MRGRGIGRRGLPGRALAVERVLEPALVRLGRAAAGVVTAGRPLQALLQPQRADPEGRLAAFAIAAVAVPPAP